MRQSVFISAVQFFAPGIESPKHVLDAFDGGPGQVALAWPLIENGDAVHYRVQIDSAHPFYPERRDLKFMRPDVVAALICMSALLKKANLKPENMATVPLFIATGFCVEDQMADQAEEMCRFFLSTQNQGHNPMQDQGIYDKVPPLFALRGLANATACFVAQTSGVRGDNATFGMTSHAGFDAFEEGVLRIEEAQADMVVVGAANGGGRFSTMAYWGFADADMERRESDCAVFVLLESENSLKSRGQLPLCRVDKLVRPVCLPTLCVPTESSPVAYARLGRVLRLLANRECALFTGGITLATFQAQKKSVETQWSAAYSWYETLGHLGAASLLFHLATAVCLLANNRAKCIDCLDCDPYGREAMIRLLGA